MTIQINQTISNTLTEDRQLIKTRTIESYVLYPEKGKVLRHKLSKKIYISFVSLSKKADIQYYEEIDDPTLKENIISK